MILVCVAFRTFVNISAPMVRELAQAILLQAATLSNAEREKAAKLSRATLCLWCYRCSAHPFVNSKFEVKWSVRKSVDGRFDLEGFPDNEFQITEYSPAVAEYLANNYLREREEDTIEHFEECQATFHDAYDGAYNDFTPPEEIVNSLKRGKIQVELYRSSEGQQESSALTCTSGLSEAELSHCIDTIHKLYMLGSFKS